MSAQARAPAYGTLRVAAALAGVGLVCAAWGAERTPADWLRRMDNAFRELDYDGTFSYYTKQNAQHMSVLGSSTSGTVEFAQSRTTARLATFRVVHKVVDGVERERIVYLNGPRREILRTGDQVACVLQPGDKLLALEGALPSGLYGRVFAKDFADVGEHYEVRFSNRDRVAGRAAVGLDVIPRDEERFGYKLWLDDQTGLLLRSELRDADGAKLEIFVFSTLRVGPRVARADLEPSMDGDLVWHRLFEPGEPQTAEASPLMWHTRWVPSGFSMTGADSFQPDDHGHGHGVRRVKTLRFSDGLTAFSVFIEPMPEDGAGSIVSRAGATVALTHRTTGAGGDHLVTVIGEVPVATARRVAASVAPSAGVPRPRPAGEGAVRERDGPPRGEDADAR